MFRHGLALPSSVAAPSQALPRMAFPAANLVRKSLSPSSPTKVLELHTHPKTVPGLGACTRQLRSWLFLAPEVDPASTSAPQGKPGAVARSSRSDRCLLLADVPSDCARLFSLLEWPSFHPWLPLSPNIVHDTFCRTPLASWAGLFLNPLNCYGLSPVSLGASPRGELL